MGSFRGVEFDATYMRRSERKIGLKVSCPPRQTVTREMIAAGASVLRASAERCFPSQTGRAERVAEQVFRAMVQSREESGVRIAP